MTQHSMVHTVPRWIGAASGSAVIVNVTSGIGSDPFLVVPLAHCESRQVVTFLSVRDKINFFVRGPINPPPPISKLV